MTDKITSVMTAISATDGYMPQIVGAAGWGNKPQDKNYFQIVLNYLCAWELAEKEETETGLRYTLTDEGDKRRREYMEARTKFEAKLDKMIGPAE